MSDISSLVDKLNKDYKDDFKIEIPSSGSVASDPLTFNQQKQIIGSIADGTASALKFQKVLSEIIKENVKSEDDIYVTDKLAIVLQLRKNAIGTVLTVGDGSHDILDDILEKALGIKKPKNKKIKYKNITIHTRVPTISYESRILNVSIDVLKKEEKNIGKSVGELFTHEIVKYIESVEVGDEKIEDFEKLSIQDRCSVVNNLPVALNKKISEHIQSIKKKELEALTVEIDGEEQTIDIDVSFFDS